MPVIKPARRAVLIGNQTYDDGSIPTLQGAAEDVSELSKILSDVAMGGFDEVVQLTDASLELIRDKLHDLFIGAQRDDLVLLYISGHGQTNLYNQLYFPVKGSKSQKLLTTALKATDLHEMMSLSPSCRQVVVLDTCYSGAFFKSGGARSTAPTISAGMFGISGEGKVVMTSTSGGTVSYEDHDTTNEGRPGKRGVFSRYFTEGIITGRAAPNKDHITVEDAFKYAANGVRSEKPSMTPQLLSELNSGQAIILARNPKWSGDREGHKNDKSFRPTDMLYMEISAIEGSINAELAENKDDYYAMYNKAAFLQQTKQFDEYIVLQEYLLTRSESTARRPRLLLNLLEVYLLNDNFDKYPSRFSEYCVLLSSLAEVGADEYCGASILYLNTFYFSLTQNLVELEGSLRSFCEEHEQDSLKVWMPGCKFDHAIRKVLCINNPFIIHRFALAVRVISGEFSCKRVLTLLTPPDQSLAR